MKPSLSNEIKKIQELRNAGVLTVQEYTQMLSALKATDKDTRAKVEGELDHILNVHG